ncbi:MAG: restriction endonuclease subunit S [Neptuniibacter caesariensis]|uniref:Restriction endonuclease subunit S n=1 Tax=Neptuniibacter caesariensis TaxID=207954 RepID=A0A2G6JBJ4_NEPCE|nr:MAG: restriction endonuclease subunit S [Neptuniibacter caesariensis]
MVDVGNCVEKVSTWSPLKSDSQDSFLYIDLSSVDKDKKLIDENLVSLVLPKEAPSRAKQIVRSEDVLVATVRPNLNGVAYVSKKFDGATASTGYCVLRPDNKKLDSKYLYYWVQTNTFIGNMMARATGANYPAVSDKIIKESKIPLPPLAEQKRIAAILDKADSIRRKRQHAIQLADELLRAVFLDMFGDPVTNPKGWELRPVGDGIESITSGWSAKGSSEPCGKGELGVLKISAVTTGIFKPEENKRVEPDDLIEGKKLIFPKKGDLIFSRANTRDLVAATCIVQEDYENLFLPDKLWLIETDHTKILPEFLNFLIWQPRFKDTLASQATGSSGSMLNISKAKFESANAIFPPMEQQLKFREIYLKYTKAIGLLFGANKQDSLLFNSLSQKAFSGQL